MNVRVNESKIRVSGRDVLGAPIDSRFDDAIDDDCVFFHRKQKRSSKVSLFSRPLAGRCAKHTELMGGKEGPKFPASAPACRHFDDGVQS